MVYVLVMNTASFWSVDGDGPNQNDDVMSQEFIGIGKVTILNTMYKELN